MYSQTKGETPDKADAMLALVTINAIPFWRDARSGRTFPQVAGAEDPPGDGDDSDGADADEHADDQDAGTDDKSRRRIQAMRAGEKRLKDLLKTQGQELESLKAKQRERDEAELSETERLKARAEALEREKADLERERQETRNVRAVEKAAIKHGAADPEDVYKLLDHSKFDRDSDGNVTNAEDLVKALLKDKPYLAGKAGTNGVPATPRGTGTETREDMVKEKKTILGALPEYQSLG